jgi:hypothetical protein
MKEELTPVQQKYISTYIQRLYLETQKMSNIEDLEKLPYHIRIINSKNKDALGLLKTVLYHAMERRDLICDINDSKHAQKKIGSCDVETHLEDVAPEIELSKEEKKEFDMINEKDGWYSACMKFINKFNPENQKVSLLLNLDEDNAKLIDDHPIYACERCMEGIMENADGGVTCDMEDYEE